MIEVKRIDKQEWSTLSEVAHLTVFNENRPETLNRVDFALLCLQDEVVEAYVTVKELDAESVYFQYGGALPIARKSITAFKCFRSMIGYCLEHGYKRISMYVKNDNFSMLKFTMAEEFKCIGMRTFGNDIFLEMFKEIRGI